MEIVNQVFLDRFEEDQAILYLGDDTSSMKKIILPREMLPENVSDGDHLTIKIDVDQEATMDAEDEAISILQRLKNRKRDDKS